MGGAVPDLEHIGPPEGYADAWSFTAPVIDMPVCGVDRDAARPVELAELAALGGPLAAACRRRSPLASNRWNAWCTVSATHRSPSGVNAMPRGSWKIAVAGRRGHDRADRAVVGEAGRRAVPPLDPVAPQVGGPHVAVPSSATATRRIVVNVPACVRLAEGAELGDEPAGQGEHLDPVVECRRRRRPAPGR